MPEIIWVKDSTGAAVAIAADQITSLNGVASTDGAFAQRVKPGWGTDGEFHDITPSSPMPVAAADVVSALADIATDGTFAYAAGTTAGTVDVPTSAELRRVSVIAGTAAAATVTIGGGQTITIPAGDSFDEQIVGAAIGADVVIGGTIQSYYVSWTD